MRTGAGGLARCIRRKLTHTYIYKAFLLFLEELEKKTRKIPP